MGAVPGHGVLHGAFVLAFVCACGLWTRTALGDPGYLAAGARGGRAPAGGAEGKRLRAEYEPRRARVFGGRGAGSICCCCGGVGGRISEYVAPTN